MNKRRVEPGPDPELLKLYIYLRRHEDGFITLSASSERAVNSLTCTFPATIFFNAMLDRRRLCWR